jgi:hypothetical protein
MNHSEVSLFVFSIIPTFHCSIIPVGFQYSNIPLFHHSNIPVFGGGFYAEEKSGIQLSTPYG